jgi:hypothetical protein
VAANDAPPQATNTIGGITIDFQRAKALDGERTVVYYRVHADSNDGFAEMLGIPRVLNRDGSMALPSSYGSVGSGGETERQVPGLPAGSAGAIYASSDIQAGAVVRFGPFFRSRPEGFTVRTTGAALLAGQEVTIGGEPFRVSAETVAGMTNIVLLNTAATPSVMATHPGSQVSVTLAGKPATVVHGSANFAKTETYDVKANQSSLILKDELPADAEVVISNTSIGAVVGGHTDFPLK